jgi:hypothetical protein
VWRRTATMLRVSGRYIALLLAGKAAGEVRTLTWVLGFAEIPGLFKEVCSGSLASEVEAGEEEAAESGTIAGDAPVEGTPVREAPAEEPPVEESPVEEPTAEESPAWEAVLV